MDERFSSGLPSLRKLLFRRTKTLQYYADKAEKTPISTEQVCMTQCEEVDQIEMSTDCGAHINYLEACVVGAYIADILCFPNSDHQVDLLSLTEFMAAFPEGFRIAYVITKDYSTIPIGYTGWFPIDKNTFAEISKGNLSNRKTPRPCLNPKQIGGIHLFNASIISSCQHKNRTNEDVKIAKPLLLAFSDDLKQFCLRNPTIKGLSTIAVSNDGSRIAKNVFQMKCLGGVQDGSGEQIWVKEF